MEGRESSPWFIAHLPAIQTMCTISLHYSLPDLGVWGEFSFLSKMNLCFGEDYSLPAALCSF